MNINNGGECVRGRRDETRRETRHTYGIAHPFCDRFYTPKYILWSCYKHILLADGVNRRALFSGGFTPCLIINTQHTCTHMRARTHTHTHTHTHTFIKKNLETHTHTIHLAFCSSVSSVFILSVSCLFFFTLVSGSSALDVRAGVGGVLVSHEKNHSFPLLRRIHVHAHTRARAHPHTHPHPPTYIHSKHTRTLQNTHRDVLIYTHWHGTAIYGKTSCPCRRITLGVHPCISPKTLAGTGPADYADAGATQTGSIGGCKPPK